MVKPCFQECWIPHDPRKRQKDQSELPLRAADGSARARSLLQHLATWELEEVLWLVQQLQRHFPELRNHPCSGQLHGNPACIHDGYGQHQHDPVICMVDGVVIPQEDEDRQKVGLRSTPTGNEDVQPTAPCRDLRGCEGISIPKLSSTEAHGGALQIHEQTSKNMWGDGTNGNGPLPDQEGGSIPEISTVAANSRAFRDPKQEADSCQDPQGPSSWPVRLPVVCFLTNIYWALEGEDVVVKVVRIGDLRSTSSVQYETEDISAIARNNYKTMSGTLTFEPGQYEQHITIPIIQNSMWGTIVDFSVNLKETSLVNAETSRYSKNARVKIIDDDIFPTNRLSKHAEAHKLRNLSPMKLVWEFSIMCVEDPIVKLGCIKILLLDLFSNMVVVLEIALRWYMIDNIFAKGKSGNTGFDPQLFIVGLLFLIPRLLMGFGAYRKNFWKVTGACRLRMSEHLVRKFLVTTPEAAPHKLQEELLQRQNTEAQSNSSTRRISQRLLKRQTKSLAHDEAPGLDQSVLLINIIHAIPETIDVGLHAMLRFFSDITELFLITLWSIFLAVRNDPSRAVSTVAPCVVFPIVIPIFLKLRGDKAFKLFMEVERAHFSVMAHIDDLTKNFNLINDYSKKGKFADTFVSKTKHHIKQIVARGAMNTNTRFFPELVSLILVTGWIILAGPTVGTPAIPSVCSSQTWTFGRSWGQFGVKSSGFSWSLKTLMRCWCHSQTVSMHRMTPVSGSISASSCRNKSIN